MSAEYDPREETTVLFCEGAFYIDRLFSLNPFTLVVIPSLLI